jgi:hypothetical protein
LDLGGSGRSFVPHIPHPKPSTPTEQEFAHMVESVKTVGLSLLMKVRITEPFDRPVDLPAPPPPTDFALCPNPTAQLKRTSPPLTAFNPFLLSPPENAYRRPNKQVTPLLILLAWWATHRLTPIYLVDFATYKPPQEWQISQEEVGVGDGCVYVCEQRVAVVVVAAIGASDCLGVRSFSIDRLDSRDGWFCMLCAPGPKRCSDQPSLPLSIHTSPLNPSDDKTGAGDHAAEEVLHAGVARLHGAHPRQLGHR